MGKFKKLSIMVLSAIVIATFIPIGGARPKAYPLHYSYPVQISDDTYGTCVSPEIAVDSDNNLHVVLDAGTEIYYVKSTNRGRTWSQPTMISDPGPSNPLTDSLDPHITIGPGGEIYVVWYQRPAGFESDEVFFTKSTDGGITWSTDVMVSTSSIPSSDPRIAVAPNGDIYVVWEEKLCYCENYLPTTPRVVIYYAKSTDGGQTWSIGEVAVPDSTEALIHPDVAIDSRGRIHVVFIHESYEQCWPCYIRSEDGGQTWGNPYTSPSWQRIDSYTSFGHWWDHPRVGIDSNDDVHVAFVRRDSSLRERVYYNATRDHGNEFYDVAVPLSDWIEDEIDGPDIATGPAGKVYVVWREGVDGSPINYAKREIGYPLWAWFMYDTPTGQTGYHGPCPSTAVAEDSGGSSHVVWSYGGTIWYWYTPPTDPVYD